MRKIFNFWAMFNARYHPLYRNLMNLNIGFEKCHALIQSTT